jgi:hypothetical protein
VPIFPTTDDSRVIRLAAALEVKLAIFGIVETGHRQAASKLIFAFICRVFYPETACTCFSVLDCERLLLLVLLCFVS